MPVKKTEIELAMQQKVRVLTKLFEAGCDTEKKLQTLELTEMLKIPSITVSELGIITELKQRVKAHTLYSYLGGGTDEQPQHQSS